MILSTCAATLFALHADNGQEAWSLPVNTNPTQAENDVLYIGADPRLIISYAASSGNELWRAQYGADIVDKPGQHSAPLPIFIIVS